MSRIILAGVRSALTMGFVLSVLVPSTAEAFSRAQRRSRRDDSLLDALEQADRLDKAGLGEDLDPASADLGRTQSARTRRNHLEARGAAPGAGIAVTAGAAEKVTQGKEGDRSWSVWGNAEYRTLLVIDEDPINDQMLIWRAGGSVMVAAGVRAFFRIDLTERFWDEPDGSGILLQDLRMGASYPLELDVPLNFVGLGTQKATFESTLTLFLPTSRVSQNQDLYAAPRLSTKARLDVISGLRVGLDTLAQNNFHRDAERDSGDPDLDARTRNYQFIASLGPAVEYGLELPEPWVGEIIAGSYLAWTYVMENNSRAGGVAEASSHGSWRQDRGWGVFVEYAPYEFLKAVLSLEQNSLVARDGIVNLVPFHRDETDFVFSVTGTY